MSESRMPNGQDIAPAARRSSLGYAISVGAAVVAGVLSLVVCALLLVDYSHRQGKNPLDSERFLDLKARLAERPQDESLKEQIRELDLQLRTTYFRQRRFAATGAWLLLGWVVVFLVAVKTATIQRRKLPMPEPQAVPHDRESGTTRLARWSVAALAMVLAGTAIFLIAGAPRQLPNRAELAAMLKPAPPPDPGTSAEPDYPSDEEIGRNWPRFRGPGGLGISAYTNLPTAWDGASGEGILWKTPVPLPGNNSPVVWEDRVFLSGATEKRREVYCFDANTGQILWQKEVSGSPQSTAEPPELMEHVGFAAPSTTTDGRRVFAIFANGDLAAFDFDGNQAWTRSLGIPKNSYGHAASLTTYRNLLLVPFDQGSPKEGLSKLLALDAATGETVWEAPRKVPNSWTSPIVIRTDRGPQVITCADPWVIAYDPADGKEIWRAKCLRQDVGPSPTFAGGMVYTANEFPCLSAIRADGQGDVSESHVLWTAEDGLPDTCSPLATAEYVFLLASYGTLTCYDAKTGEMLWEEYEAFNDASFTSSPSLAGNRLYLFGEVEEEEAKDKWVMKGKTWIVEPGREGCKVVATADLGEGCVTSPAFQEGRIYIRGSKHLFCIGGNGTEMKSQP